MFLVLWPVVSWFRSLQTKWKDRIIQFVEVVFKFYSQIPFGWSFIVINFPLFFFKGKHSFFKFGAFVCFQWSCEWFQLFDWWSDTTTYSRDINLGFGTWWWWLIEIINNLIYRLLFTALLKIWILCWWRILKVTGIYLQPSLIMCSVLSYQILCRNRSDLSGIFYIKCALNMGLMSVREKCNGSHVTVKVAVVME